MIRNVLRLSLLAMLLGISSNSLADIIIQPPGLTTGDQYRLAFVTTGRRDSLSANIADYNSFVTTAANSQLALSTLNTTWKAIASTTTIDARVNTGTVQTSAGGNNGVPIYLLNGTQLASGNDMLWGTSLSTFLMSPLSITEQGSTRTGVRVWTGTNAFGVGDDPLGFGTPWYGDSSLSTSGWILAGDRPMGEGYSLYALSGTLTAVPEPSSFMLVGSLIGLAMVRRRKLH
ncbi:MAG: PEP-CTERM sorting domain-containing protein [Pirellulaceae bacterium]